MIDAAVLLKDAQGLADLLVDDLRQRTEIHDESRIATRGTYEQAHSVGRTDKTYEEWREDLLAQVASAWVLGCVFVRFCEDNGLHDTPLLSGPGDRRELARDHRAAFFAQNPAAGDREWLEEVFRRYRDLPGTSAVFGERNPLWQLAPRADGAKALSELWWATADEGRTLRHDFTDPELDTRFLGDLYQDLSEHARKQYALLQTPEFVEEFILDRTLDPAIETFGLDTVKMIDPTCGSGHFLLGAFDRLLERWRQAEPATSVRELAQRALGAVNGVDINPFAAEIARFRVLVAALRACDIERLTDAPNFDINIAVGDSLLHGTAAQLLLVDAPDDPLHTHRYPTEDGVAANRLLSQRYHCVVGNPPYIIVRDRALNEAYRNRYMTCHRKFSLGVPFTERMWTLAAPAPDGGFVGLITANSFTKRELGKKIIEQFFPTRDLTHVLDTSGAYLPGHGTPTVLLFGRNRPPAAPTVRMALGVEGESSVPQVASEGLVWKALTFHLDDPAWDGRYITTKDVDRSDLADHPWSLRGGAAPDVQRRMEAAPARLADYVDDFGFGAISGADDQFSFSPDVARRLSLEASFIRPVVEGRSVRDWAIEPDSVALFPYGDEGVLEIDGAPRVHRFLWPRRTTLGQRTTFAKRSYVEEGRSWWEWHQVVLPRSLAQWSFHVAEVATHNHFAPFTGPHVGKQTAPIALLSANQTPDDGLRLLSVLNSSSACFWMKEVCYPKGGDQVGTDGARVRKTLWDEHYAFNVSNLLDLPLPWSLPQSYGAELAKRAAQTSPQLGDRRSGPESLCTVARKMMVSLQEELDWACYRLYGFIDADLTYPIEELPPIDKGQRAFEIALARRMAAGESASTWFDRHGSAPITEIPPHWPEGYQRLVARRLELIDSDRAIQLLERPEYKRRWNWDNLADLEKEAKEHWLLDRIEELLSDADREQPEVTTVARLADQLWRDDDARRVAEDLAGADVEPVKLVARLVSSAGVPYLSPYRLKKTGLVKRQAWERTWELQRIEDTLDARAELPADHEDHLTAEGLTAAKKTARVDKIPVPPNYASSDFRHASIWKLRGKLDVPKERFILYPSTRAGADTSAVVGWAGWDHLQQARALAGLYTARKHDGAEVDELTPLLAGILELLPWVLQWHDDPDPVYGERMGQFFTGFLENERAALGLSEDDLKDWRP